MEIVEVEAALEKIWDLHDKLSDAIHSISRTHFLNSVETMKKSEKKKQCGDDNRIGFVYVKDYDIESAIAEAKSLNSIRTALENLEDQLGFFHTIQIHQLAERDAALARLDQSRIILALRLAEHRGKKYKVIEEALNLVGDVRDASSHVSLQDLSGQRSNSQSQTGPKTNLYLGLLLSALDRAKKSLKMEGNGGILGNAAIFVLSMISLVHLQRVPWRGKYIIEMRDRTLRNVAGVDGSSSSSKSESDNLDVLFARG